MSFLLAADHAPAEIVSEGLGAWAPWFILMLPLAAAVAAGPTALLPLTTAAWGRRSGTP